MALLEDLIISRGRKAYSGQINPWDLSQWQPSVQGVRTMGARTLEDLSSTLRKSDVSGPAAATLMGRAQEGTQGNILNLATNLAGVPEGYVQQGLGAEQNKEQRELERMKMLIAAREARKSRHQAKKMAQFQSMESVSGGEKCCWIFESDGRLTQAVKEVRDELFSPKSYVARGYTAMAQWLVPLIYRHKSIRLSVRWLMLNPIGKFCERKNPVLIPICTVWALVWEFYGRINDLCNYSS